MNGPNPKLWHRIDASVQPDEIEALIEHYVEESLDSLREQFEADALSGDPLTDAEKADIEAHARVHVRQACRRTFEQALARIRH